MYTDTEEHIPTVFMPRRQVTHTCGQPLSSNNGAP